MPVGTQGAVKAVRHRELEEAGAEIILGNTYHLLLRPGDELIARRGGLHRFIGWDRPILTDSGGFQVYSLAQRRAITEEGADFQSHLDGTRYLLTPERATDIQARLGSDIAMAFDECLAYPATREQAAEAMARSARWAERCRRRFLEPAESGTVAAAAVSNSGQAQFGIVQGGIFQDLRDESADATVARRVRGVRDWRAERRRAESSECMRSPVDTARRLPHDRPRYLMGVGTPEDLVECVARGIDMFDCVLPTRNARNGQLFTSQGRINIRERQVRRGRWPARSASAAATRAAAIPGRICVTCTWPAR